MVVSASIAGIGSAQEGTAWPRPTRSCGRGSTSRAWFGAKVDERADPKIQIQQAIEDAQQQHEQLTRQAANVIGNQRQLEMRLDRQLGQIETLQEQARQALVLADKARADGDAAKAAEFEQTAQALANQLVGAEQSVQDMKTMHDQALQAAQQARQAVQDNSMMLQEKLTERTKLLSQLEQAKMQEQVSASLQQMSEMAAPKNVPTLDEVRDKIEKRYAVALGQADLAQGTMGGRMLDVKRATLDLKGSARSTRSGPRSPPRSSRRRIGGATAGRRPPAVEAAPAAADGAAAARPPAQPSREPQPEPSARPRGWQVGHHQVSRSRGGVPWRACSMSVPQRRQGWPDAQVDPVLLAARRASRWSTARGDRGCGAAAGRPCRRSGRDRRTVADRRPRIDAADEQHLGLVQVADAGQVALIEQRLADRRIGLRAQPARRAAAGVPVRAEQVGAEVADQLGLVGGRRSARRSWTRRPIASQLLVADRARGSDADRAPARRSAGRRRPSRHDPSMRRWLCRVSPPANRIRMCLPRATTSVIVSPVRSAVASCGTRRSKVVTAAPGQRGVAAACAVSQTVSPSGIGRPLR